MRFFSFSYVGNSSNVISQEFPIPGIPTTFSLAVPGSEGGAVRKIR
jgi:hypothetical protein